MPAVFIPVKLKGRKGETKVEMLANTGSDLVVLTEEIAKKIDPKPMGYEEEFIKVGNEKVKSAVYSIEVEVRDETKKTKRGEVLATVLRGQDIPLLGNLAMEKLEIILDMKEGKFKLR